MSLDPSDVDPFGPGNRRWCGRSIVFEYVGKTLTGTVISQAYAGRTKRGDIPDWTLKVQGASGKTLEISLVESRATFPE